MCGRLWSRSGRAMVSLRDRSSGGTGAGWLGMLLSFIAHRSNGGFHPFKRSSSPAGTGGWPNIECMAIVGESRPREQRSDAARNREALVRAATAAVHREGPHVPLAIIAADAGVGIGTLYRHFSARE